MNIELASDLLSQRVLQQLDSRVEGAFVEVGLGNVDFSFAWAAPLGYRCWAVEALPSDYLRDECARHGVTLVAAAMAEQRGEIPIYVGTYAGGTISDCSSLNPRWWGSSRTAQMVPSLALADLFADQQIERVSLLKVDTEGSEAMILRGLKAVPAPLLPEIVVFEYGGGATRASKEGGWGDEFFSSTLDCLSILKDLGYRTGLLIEQCLPRARRFDLQTTADFAPLFPMDAYVGNILATRRELSPAEVDRLNRAVAPALFADACKRTAKQSRVKVGHLTHRIADGLKRRLVPSKKA